MTSVGSFVKGRHARWTFRDNSHYNHSLSSCLGRHSRTWLRNDRPWSTTNFEEVRMKIQPLKGEGVLSCLSLHGVQPGVCLSNCTRKSALLNRRKERGSSLFILWVYQLSPVQVGALTTNICNVLRYPRSLEMTFFPRAW
ncbi:hypothetical protein P167DRAFT_434536 [Morchella conica CCBAS932]|uniref:Uncharacterized protein n=1 Tax=Morchella conica CCBAS932 TaxID=1392247 RepID=A0A3N4KCF2_9PEZI|nr:hypothetical protein P167DRAFT_434536 [Morchella conica CCBAS932]